VEKKVAGGTPQREVGMEVRPFRAKKARGAGEGKSKT